MIWWRNDSLVQLAPNSREVQIINQNHMTLTRELDLEKLPRREQVRLIYPSDDLGAKTILQKLATSNP